MRRDALVPAVMQHDAMQKTLALLLDKLGLQRVPVPVEDPPFIHRAAVGG